MSSINDKARRKNKYNGSKLYDAYLADEENGRRRSLTEMTGYSACYYLCLTPNYKKVKRFTCDNCYLTFQGGCPDGFPVEFIKKYNITSMRKQNSGCIWGMPRTDYYEVSGRLFSEILKDKKGEYWIRYNKEAHKLWQDVGVPSPSRDRGRRPVFTGSQGR